MLTNRKSSLCCLWANLRVGSHIQNNLAAIDVYLFWHCFPPPDSKTSHFLLVSSEEGSWSYRQTTKKHGVKPLSVPILICSISATSVLGHSRDTWSHNSGSFDQSQQNCAGLSTGACTSSPRWRDLCLLQQNLLEITSVLKHRSGPLCRSRHQEPLYFPSVCLQKPLSVGCGASREILSSDGMYYKEYMWTVMVLTPITLPWRKFSLFCPFISVSHFCFSFSSLHYFLWNLGVFILLSTCHCSLIVLEIESTIFGMARSEMEPVVHHFSCRILTYVKLISPVI